MENERKPRQLTTLQARNFEHKENVPCITLSGRWLKEYGSSSLEAAGSSVLTTSRVVSLSILKVFE